MVKRAPITSPKVLRKALPAVLLLLAVFVSLMFVINYTEAFYLVILLWIVAPVALVQFYRKMTKWLQK